MTGKILAEGGAAKEGRKQKASVRPDPAGIDRMLYTQRLQTNSLHWLR